MSYTHENSSNCNAILSRIHVFVNISLRYFSSKIKRQFDKFQEKGKIAMSIINKNTLIEVQQADGTVERHFPITRYENILGLKNITDTQNRALQLLAANPYVVDEETNKVMKIGSRNGKLFVEESEISVKELMDAIVNIIEDK